MSDWNSSKPRLLAELLGSGAVLLGLVFVGLELRQNTAAIQSATAQGATELSINWLSDVTTSPEFAAVWFKALSSPEQLEGPEAMQVAYFLRSSWARTQNAYYQWRRGSLSDADWAVYEETGCRQPSDTPGGQIAQLRISTWSDHKVALTDEFVAFIEDCWSHALR